MARAGATRAPARGVTDLAIGSSDWLGSEISHLLIVLNCWKWLIVVVQ